MCLRQCVLSLRKGFHDKGYFEQIKVSVYSSTIGGGDAVDFHSTLRYNRRAHQGRGLRKAVALAPVIEHLFKIWRQRRGKPHSEEGSRGYRSSFSFKDAPPVAGGG